MNDQLMVSFNTAEGGRVLLYQEGDVLILRYHGEVVWRSTDKKSIADNLVVNITCDTSRALRKIEELRKEITSLSLDVVDPPHNHPLPEGFTAHDGSVLPRGLTPSTRVIVQFGDGDGWLETPSTGISPVHFWYDKIPEDNHWYWMDGKPGPNDIIAYKVVS